MPLDSPFHRPPGPADAVTVNPDPPSLDVLQNLRSAYGETVAFDSPKGRLGYFVNDAEYVRSVLVRNHPKYVKGPGFEMVKLLLGNGLIVSDGQTWRRSRTMVAPGFTRQSLQKLMSVIVERCESKAERWHALALAGEPVNITREMSGYALDIILKAIFGRDYETRIIAGGDNPFSFLSHDPSRDLKFVLKVRALRELMLEVIADRRKSGRDDEYDFLSAYLAAEDKGGERYSDRELLDELMSLIVAGFETSAGTLNWAWYLIAGHPEVEQKICAEACKHVPDASSVGNENVAGLTYLQQVIEETLRLYPPVWLFTRRAVVEDRLGKYDVPAGTDIYISPYILQRSEQYWPEPQRFDPDRFVGNGDAKRSAAYIPFSLGSRRCIGEYLAYLEMKIQIGLLLPKFRMERVSADEPGLDLGVNLRSKSDIYLQPGLRQS